MSNDQERRVEDLEIRIMHLEAALDEMTRSLLQQEQLTARQADMIRQLETQLKGLSSALLPGAEHEPPPPHY
jgi:SlyX protein